MALPEDVVQYLQVDEESLGLVSYFNSVVRLESAHTEVGTSYDWLFSHVKGSKRICNSSDGFSILFYECMFSRLKEKNTFCDFKERVLKLLWNTSNSFESLTIYDTIIL